MDIRIRLLILLIATLIVSASSSRCYNTKCRVGAIHVDCDLEHNNCQVSGAGYPVCKPGRDPIEQSTYETCGFLQTCHSNESGVGTCFIPTMRIIGVLFGFGVVFVILFWYGKQYVKSRQASLGYLPASSLYPEGADDHETNSILTASTPDDTYPKAVEKARRASDPQYAPTAALSDAAHASPYIPYFQQRSTTSDCTAPPPSYADVMKLGG